MRHLGCITSCALQRSRMKGEGLFPGAVLLVGSLGLCVCDAACAKDTCKVNMMSGPESFRDLLPIYVIKVGATKTPEDSLSLPQLFHVICMGLVV
jgi:hypothetical protein